MTARDRTLAGVRAPAAAPNPIPSPYPERHIRVTGALAARQEPGGVVLQSKSAIGL